MTPIVLQDKSVEVTSINHLLRTFSIVVHVQVPAMALHTKTIQALIVKKVRCASNYLVKEGFIPDPIANKWTINITGIADK